MYLMSGPSNRFDSFKKIKSNFKMESLQKLQFFKHIFVTQSINDDRRFRPFYFKFFFFYNFLQNMFFANK